MSKFQAAFYEGNQGIRIGGCTPVPPKPSEVQIQVSYCGISHLFFVPKCMLTILRAYLSRTSSKALKA